MSERNTSPHLIYLDHNATTPVLPKIWQAAEPYLCDYYGNPSSQHWAASKSAEAIQRARSQVAQLIGAEPNQIVFTSGGTESNHLVMWGALRTQQPGRLLISNVEHPAVSKPAEALVELGWELIKLPVDAVGRVQLKELQSHLEHGLDAMSVMLANNETGTIQPVQELVQRVRPHGVLTHTDAAQAVGKIPVDVNELGVDFLSIAGHKLYAPKGIGALYVRNAHTIQPIFLGGGQEQGLRPGTPNVPHIVALGAACQLAFDDLERESARQRALVMHFEQSLKQVIPDIARNGCPSSGLPNTLSVRFPHVEGATLLAQAPEIAASTGSACHENTSTASNIILAMGIPPEEALGTVRLSIGRSTTTATVDRAVALLQRAWLSVQCGA